MNGGDIGDSRNSHSNAFGIGGDAFGGRGFAGEAGSLSSAESQHQGREKWESFGDQDLKGFDANDKQIGGSSNDSDQSGPGNVGIHLRGMPQQVEGWKLDGQGQRGGHASTGNDGDSNSNMIGGGSSDTPVAKASKEVHYGLGGLIEVIKMSDKDLSALALGVDLLTLGLNLNSQDCLYSFFNSPFTDQPSALENQYVTPQCYLMQHPPSLKPEHLTKYQLETLFYMFFTAPRDIKQACAAQELYRREWRYHGELMLWLKPRGPQELMLSHPNVYFQYFDVGSWETRLFTNSYRGNIASGLLSEADIRVKTQS
jgi:CCR4-NOT transcription complex subunit 2